MTTPFVRSTMKWMADSGIDPTEMHWFDISGIFKDETIVPVDWLMEYRPPFEKCMVVYQGPSRTHASYEMLMTVVGTDPYEGIIVSVFKGVSGQAPRKVPSLVYLIDGDVVRYGPAEDGETVTKEDSQMILGVITKWYQALAAGTQAYAPVVKPTFTNQRKIAAGKQPSYDWTTVVIGATKPRSESHGGTHASPRQHDRRGHLRRLRTGKNVWVKAHKVGRADLGAVFHDYAVRVA